MYLINTQRILTIVCLFGVLLLCGVLATEIIFIEFHLVYAI